MIEIDDGLRIVLERIALSLESIADSAEAIAAALGPPKKVPPKPTPSRRRRPDLPLPGEPSTEPTRADKPEKEKS